MSAGKAIKLFATDCDISVFSAELDQPKLRVHVYPMKSRAGFVWILRSEMDLDDIDACVIDGDRLGPNCNLNDAATIAVARMFQYVANT